MFATSSIEISRSALENNFSFIRSMLGPKTRFSSVVKGNAYGHGIELFVPLAESCGITHFSVFSADEALRVSRVSNGESAILIMGQLENDQLEWAIENGIEFFVFEPNRLNKALEVAKRTGRSAKVHLEVETGMNRTGLDPHQFEKAADLILDNPYHLAFEGLCTHFAGAESIANYYRIKKQWINFRKALKTFTSKKAIPNSQHAACSAAAMRYPDTQLDMARIGILQYGFFPSKEVFVEYITKEEARIDPLKRLITWKSKVMDIKPVKTGEFIGYGTSYMANQDMTVAVIPVGYSHGFSRSLSNQGRVLIHGTRTSVVGTVNMNNDGH